MREKLLTHPVSAAILLAGGREDRALQALIDYVRDLERWRLEVADAYAARDHERLSELAMEAYLAERL